LKKPKLMLTVISLVIIAFPLIPNAKASTLTLTVSTNQQYYLISESITVYGTLTYNGIPVQDWPVALEIQDPNNTIITRTLQTSTNGTFTLTFKLSSNAKKGTYTAYASSSYKGETTTNHTTFQVSPVKNTNTQLGYKTIQEAINAPETLNGHTILVSAGTYHENFVVNKSISLIGENKDTTIIDGGGNGTVMRVIANDTIVSGFTIRKSGMMESDCGIQILDNYGRIIKNVTVVDNIVKDNNLGIFLWHSMTNTIKANEIYNNNFGVSIDESAYNCIILNTISNNSGGVWLGSGRNIISNNTVTLNKLYGIQLDGSSSNTVEGNNIKNNWYGIELDLSEKNNITENNITSNNGYGITLGFSSDNFIFYNNFVNNTHQVHTYKSVNVWDDGYPSGGNYWSDYSESDVFSGAYQNETGSDGIGDTAYVIDTDNADRYPLMKPYPWHSHDIGLTSLTASKTIVSQGCSLTVNLTAFNYGQTTENLNITLYANTTLIHQTNTTLASRNSTTLTITWNTTGFAKGNYTIWAYATPVSGETDTADNTYTDGEIWLKWPYDVTGDNYCGIDDIVTVAERFGTEPGGPPNSNGFYYHPIYDITCDDYIGIDDIVEIAEHFGQTDP